MYNTAYTKDMKDWLEYRHVLAVREWIGVEFPAAVVESERFGNFEERHYICNYKLDENGNSLRLVIDFDGNPQGQVRMQNPNFPNPFSDSALWAQLEIRSESDWICTRFIDWSQEPHKYSLVATTAEGLALIRPRMEQLQSNLRKNRNPIYSVYATEEMSPAEYSLVFVVRQWIDAEFPTAKVLSEKWSNTERCYICDYRLDNNGNVSQLIVNFGISDMSLSLMNPKFPTSCRSILWAQLGSRIGGTGFTELIDWSETPTLTTSAATLAEGLALIRPRIEQLQSSK
jgi:hypothetical protein